MHSRVWRNIVWPLLLLSTSGFAQQSNSCASLMHFKAPSVEISKAAPIAAGTTEPNPWGPGHSAPIPAYCRVEGVINRRTGVGGEEFGINFALAMPEKWNGDFLMQGGGGGNGVVMAPLGLNAAGDTPALMRGFAVVSTDTGHKSHRGPFDFDFMKDEQAYLDFAYLANAQVAALAKQLIAQYYGKPAAFSYFSGCSTGGREGMILSQRYPAAFDGIISGDPAMRTGLSNLAIGKWIPVAFNQIAPKDADGKPIIAQAISDVDRKLIADALLQKCDAKDGVADGIISDPLGCDFDPAALTCKEGKSESCLTSRESCRDQESRWRPKDFWRSSGIPRFSIRHRHHRQRSSPRDSFPRTRHFRTSNYSDGSRCREGSTRGYSASRGLDVHQPDDVLRARREADLLSRRQRSLVFPARHVRLLQGYVGCERRPRSRF